MTINRSIRSHRLKLGLRADSGLAVGQFYPLTATRNIIGRSVDAAVAVDDGKASRHHAAVDLQNNFYVLVDLGSTNGTYINGQRLEKGRFINLGDRIRVGSSTFVVEDASKARHQSTKNWREPTSLQVPLAREASQQGGVKTHLPTPAQPRRRESTGSLLGWQQLKRWVPSLSDAQMASSPVSRWILVGLALVLVVGAIFVRG